MADGKDHSVAIGDQQVQFPSEGCSVPLAVRFLNLGATHSDRQKCRIRIAVLPGNGGKGNHRRGNIHGGNHHTRRLILRRTGHKYRISGLIHAVKVELVVQQQALQAGVLQRVQPGADIRQLPLNAAITGLQAGKLLRIGRRIIIFSGKAENQCGSSQRHRKQQDTELPVGFLFPRFPGRLIAFDDFLHHFQLGISQFLLLPGRILLHAQQPANADAKQPAQSDELIDFRDGGVRFPFGDGLPGDTHLVSQSLLRKLLIPAALGNPLTHGFVIHTHSSLALMASSYQNQPCTATIRRLASVNRQLRWPPAGRKRRRGNLRAAGNTIILQSSRRQ